MRLPNLLDTRVGRLVVFFFLYVTEGIPLGFAATAVATQLRRQDVGPAEIGAFVGSFYLPWAFKWAFGPFIDVFTSERLGRRRGWILGTQIMLIITLLACTGLNLPAQLGVLTGVLLVHNTFGAMQDVAIDALAVNTLQADERGLANGVMFAGAAIGSAVGGSGVLFLMPVIGLLGGFVFVAACILHWSPSSSCCRCARHPRRRRSGAVRAWPRPGARCGTLRNRPSAALWARAGPTPACSSRCCRPVP
jgi:PAT family beta-lactamase induction signal transducer AmpG